jgi:uncharacterized protein (TIGR00730 family)
MSSNEKKIPETPFHSIREEISQIEKEEQIFNLAKSHYTLAFIDQNFLLREELRSMRVEMELLRTELVLQDHQIKDTVVFFGSARMPDQTYAEEIMRQAEQAFAQDPKSPELKRQYRIAKNIYENSFYLAEATKLAKMISTYQEANLVVLTGGGRGYMRAANRGAQEANARSISLCMLLPNDKHPNEFVTPELTFQFHYFAARKMHFLIRAKALVVFPGGFGTFDELFETLTLMQTRKIKRLPLILFSKRFWNRVVNFEALVEEGVIDEEDLTLFRFVETAEEALAIILDFYQLPQMT